MKFTLVKAEQSIILTVFIQDSSSTTGAGLGSLDQTSSITGGYVKRDGTGVALAVDQNVTTEGTYEAPSTAAQVRIGTPANMIAGTYEFHFHNDLFTTTDWVTMSFAGASNMAPLLLEIQLTTFDLNASVTQTGDSFARIGVNGAGLSNIGLPNQTMNITGSLSGSVGSVAGNVDGLVSGTVAGKTPSEAGDAMDLVANAVDSTSIANNAITAAKINADAITAAKIADDAIAAEHLATGAIVAATFAANAITSTVVADNLITAAKLNADCITNAKIADDAIAAENLATGAIAADAVASTALDNITMSNLVGVPTANASIVEALSLLYMALRNKQTGTSSAQTISNDAGATIATAVLSDAAGTTTKEEYA